MVSMAGEGGLGWVLLTWVMDEGPLHCLPASLLP